MPRARRLRARELHEGAPRAALIGGRRQDDAASASSANTTHVSSPAVHDRVGAILADLGEAALPALWAPPAAISDFEVRVGHYRIVGPGGVEINGDPGESGFVAGEIVLRRILARISRRRS